VTFQAGPGVVGSHLLVNASVPGLSEEEFLTFAEDAKTNCPISQALGGVPITLEAELA
jgi:osmotically inducible protein OsmC